MSGNSHTRERGKAILEEFSERASVSNGRKPIEDFGGLAGYLGVSPDAPLGYLYVPPWREVLSSGYLGPWYGGNKSSFRAANQKWLESYAAGGLWDEEENERTLSRPIVDGRSSNYKSRSRKKRPRYDQKAMDRFFCNNSVDLPDGEIEIYFSYWRDGKTISRIADTMGLSRKTIESWIARLRGRLAKAEQDIRTPGKALHKLRRRREGVEIDDAV